MDLSFGTNSFTLTAQQNPDAVARSGTVIVSSTSTGGEIVRSFTVTQVAAEGRLTISPETQLSESNSVMNAKVLCTLTISIALFISLSGCSPDNEVELELERGVEREVEREDEINVEREDEYEISLSVPSPFQIIIPESGVNLKNEISSQLDRAHASFEMTSTSDVNGAQAHIEESDFAYMFNDIASLSEFYLVDVKIDGFILTEIEISRYGFTYVFRCIEDSWGNEISITMQRLEDSLTPDEAWQIVSEQALNDIRGHLIVDDMIYRDRVNSILARIGNTYFNIRVPDRLNNYEFLRDLALEIIASSELVFLDFGTIREELTDFPVDTDSEVDDYEDAEHGSSETVNDDAEN